MAAWRRRGPPWDGTSQGFACCSSFQSARKPRFPPLGRGFLLSIQLIPKNNHAEIELIDKRNVQTYGDRAVVRPLTILAVPNPPFLKLLGISVQPKLCLAARAL